MALNVGDRLGHYDIATKIGEGGTGEVWQATDTKLHRDVALKILPEAFAQDPDLWVANYYSARNPLRLSVPLRDRCSFGRFHG